MSPYMSHSSDKYPQYSLYAVVVHLDVSSAEFSGHYVCYVKNYRKKWFKIDDSVVISVDLERVLSEEAYMLLYARYEFFVQADRVIVLPITHLWVMKRILKSLVQYLANIRSRSC